MIWQFLFCSFAQNGVPWTPRKLSQLGPLGPLGARRVGFTFLESGFYLLRVGIYVYLRIYAYLRIYVYLRSLVYLRIYVYLRIMST